MPIAKVNHPSVLIREEMDARGWTLDDLATQMVAKRDWGITRLALDIYFACKDEPNCRLGEHMADALAAAFGVDGDFFRNLEAQWLASARREET